MPLILPDFRSVHILVVGDVLLDQYWSGATRRISPEAPVPVVVVDQEEVRLGGAGNVAANLRALGAGCTLLAPVGADAGGRTLAQLLRRHGIDNQLLIQKNRLTVKKLRVVSQNQQLVRLDFERPCDANSTTLVRKYKAALKRCDAVILSDYGTGTLADPQPLIKLAKQAGKEVFVDPKRSDFAAYAGATVVKPNRHELEQAAGPTTSMKDIQTQAEKLRRRHRLKAMLVTLSEQGMWLQQGRGGMHLKAVGREVFDVTGAGDTVIATFASARAAGLPFKDAMRLANHAAGCVVAKFGAAAVTPEELARAIRSEGRMTTGIVTRNALLRLVRDSRAAGESIVFTNGCFDILHAGHVDLLERAAQLGDRLIVAVNSDASVRLNKGSERPIQPLKHRQRLLAGLECVDWVVSFSQKTPEQLLRAVLPDVLVKGADYRVEQLAGADAVKQAGGKVVLLPLVAEQSSTRLIRLIREKK